MPQRNTKKTPSTPITQHESPLWNRNVKLIIALCAIVLIVITLWTFRALIHSLVIAGILAYLLDPIITWLDDKSHLKRGHVILIVYALFLLFAGYILIRLGFAAYDQITSFIRGLPRLLENAIRLIEELAQQKISIGPFTLQFAQNELELDALAREVRELAQQSINEILQRSTTVVSSLAQLTLSTFSVISSLFFIMMLSVYISNDMPRLGHLVADWAGLPGYRQDAQRLWLENGRIWRAYLRGQIILAFVMGIVVWLVLSLLGVQNALALGFLAGMLEFLPILGPLFSGGIAAVVAFFQPENWLGLSSWQYVLLIIAMMFVLQQIENAVLVPRIVGESLDLHPIVVLLAVFMGSSLAGILGAVLAAPVAAMLKLLLGYVWNKMFDQNPFPDPPEPISTESFLNKLLRWRDRYRAKNKK